MRGPLSSLAFLCLCSVILVPASSDAQVPVVRVAFGADGSKIAVDCPGPILDTLAVTANNFNTYLGSIEFGVMFPTAVTLIAELPVKNVAVWLGTADVTAGPWFGLTIGYGNDPVNAFSAAIIHRMLISWNCTGCNPPVDDLITVVPNGLTGLLQAIEWPTGRFFDVVGAQSFICATNPPVAQRTWGQIKALYQ